MNLLFILTIVYAIYKIIQESNEKTIPIENWNNKQQFYKDMLDDNISIKQCINNLETGKYKTVKEYPKPHRNIETGKIIIENCKLYNQDLIKYGAVQTMEWVEQGKYNLTPDERKKEQERIKAHYKKLYEQ